LSELGPDALKRISTLLVPNERHIINKLITAPKRGERSSRLEFHTSIIKVTVEEAGQIRRQKKRTVTRE
jgi:hypothetical protein